MILAVDIEKESCFLMNTKIFPCLASKFSLLFGAVKIVGAYVRNDLKPLFLKERIIVGKIQGKLIWREIKNVYFKNMTGQVITQAQVAISNLVKFVFLLINLR